MRKTARTVTSMSIGVKGTLLPRNSKLFFNKFSEDAAEDASKGNAPDALHVERHLHSEGIEHPHHGSKRDALATL